jgi:hypothetical protein
MPCHIQQASSSPFITYGQNISASVGDGAGGGTTGEQVREHKKRDIVLERDVWRE